MTKYCSGISLGRKRWLPCELRPLAGVLECRFPCKKTTFSFYFPSYLGGSIGGFGHILMEQILRKEGLEATYMPFKGGRDTAKALLGGHVHIMIGDTNFSLLEAGETRQDFSSYSPKAPRRITPRFQA